MRTALAIDPIERTNFALCAGAFAASFWLATPAFAWSLGLGALLEAVNFRGLRRSAHALLTGQLAGGRGWSALFAFRFGLLVLGIGVALAQGAHPIGLLIGLSLIMPAALFEAWRTRPPLDPTAPALAPDDPSWDRWDAWRARERETVDEDDEA
jgi:hypothetical protein